MIHDSTKIASWRMPEYFGKRERGTDWFWALGIILVGIIVLSVMAGNYLFVFFLVLATVLFILMNGQKSRMVTVEISEIGIKIDDTLHLFQNIPAFWITQRPHDYVPHLLIHDLEATFHVDSVPIDESVITVAELRNLLLEVTNETEIYEPFLTRAAHWMGL